MATEQVPRTHSPDGLRLSYVIGSYPVLTTTFIDREIQGLIDRGVDLRIVSIRRPSMSLSPAQRPLQERVEYLLPPPIPGLVAAHVTWAIRRPRVYLGTLLDLLRRPHDGASRLRTVLHFGTGVFAAYRLRDRPGVHVHAHFVDRAATVAMVVSRLLGSTYSVTAHANDIYRSPVLLPEKIGRARFAVTCTEYNRRHLASSLGPDLEARILRIYHGVDLRAYAPRPDPSAGRPMILAVGQLKEKKGLRYLVEACRILADRGLDFECRIVGHGPLHDELDGLVRDRSLSDRVTLCGPLPHPDVVELYRGCTVFVLPCVVASDGDRDGIPNVILEAMAMEVPVISTDVSGIPEVVRDGETGVLVKPADPVALADAIGRLLDAPDLRRALGSAGRELVTTEFEIGRNVDRLREAFAHA
jgi:glycosyltransferase involved in cell wall biosynthesis